MFVDVEVKDSDNAGKGCFTKQRIPKGAVVDIFPIEARIIKEEDYLKQQKNNHLVEQSGVRWVGNYFMIGYEICEDDFINHSDNPNLLYHCGICFAKRDIDSGEELTVNYQYFLSKKDNNLFTDCKTGRRIQTLSGKEALEQSTKELVQLLKELNEIPSLH